MRNLFLNLQAPKAPFDSPNFVKLKFHRQCNLLNFFPWAFVHTVSYLLSWSLSTIWVTMHFHSYFRLKYLYNEKSQLYRLLLKTECWITTLDQTGLIMSFYFYKLLSFFDSNPQLITLFVQSLSLYLMPEGVGTLKHYHYR